MTTEKDGLESMAARCNPSRAPTIIDRNMRGDLMKQRPAVIWFTGLSGAGKSTIANELESLLYREGKHTFILDGDCIRRGLNSDLGFTSNDRVENLRRIAEVARLMAEAGLIVIVAFISPFRAERLKAREIVALDGYIEVFIDTPFEVCAQRDPKGLYAKAFRGEIKDFTGIDSPYEVPTSPEIHLHTASSSPRQNALEIKGYLTQKAMI